MQLIPTEPLKQQMNVVSGHKLEDITAAALCQLGYFTLTGLKKSMNGQDICEIDVFATELSLFHESRVVVECKGGNIKPDKMKTFTALPNILSIPPDDSFLIVYDRVDESRRELAKLLGTSLMTKTEFVSIILPILNIKNSREEKLKAINRYLAVFEVIRFFESQISSFDPLKRYYRKLKYDLWEVENPIEMKTLSKDIYDAFSQVKQDVENNTDRNSTTNVYQADDDLLEALSFVSCFHKLLNVYAVVRCAMYYQRQSMRDELLEEGTNLRVVMNEMTLNPKIAYSLPWFFQYWLYVWGGCIRDQNTTINEYELLANEIHVSTDVIHSYFNLLSRIFSGMNSDIIQHRSELGMVILKYVPAAFRYLGMKHRVEMGYSDANCYRLWKDNYRKTCHRNYMRALDRALASDTGEHGNLMF